MGKGEGKYIVNEVRHMLTYDCNLRCLHCYVSAGEHSNIKAIEFTQGQADDFYGFFKPESVSATGGEPLLYFNLVKILAKSTAKYGGSLELVTNGLLLTREILTELNDLNSDMFYQISLDGIEEFHDYLRQKRGAYRNGAIKAINLCSKSGKLTKARMTITTENYDQIPEVIKILDEFERTNIQLIMRSALDVGRANKNKLSFGNDLISKLKSFRRLARFIKISVTDRCGYCLDSISVDPLGDIYPCSYFVFNPEYKMGHMSDPVGLQLQPDFVNYTGKCFAVEKFSANTAKNGSRCKICITKEFLKLRG